MAITANDVFRAVADKWDSVGALATAFPGGISRNTAQADPEHDYVYFNTISNVRTETTSHNETWLSVFRFEVFTPISPEQAGDKAKVIADAFDPAVLTIPASGAVMQRLRRIADDAADSGDWKVNQMNLTYECEWSKPRSDLAVAP